MVAPGAPCRDHDIAHFKTSRIMYIDYRPRLAAFHDTNSAVVALHFLRNRLNNPHGAVAVVSGDAIALRQRFIQPSGAGRYDCPRAPSPAARTVYTHKADTRFAGANRPGERCETRAIDAWGRTAMAAGARPARREPDPAEAARRSGSGRDGDCRAQRAPRE